MQLLSAAVFSVAVILSAPFVGQIRALLRAALPEGFVPVVGAAVAVAVLAALAAALVLIRDRRPLRYGMIAGAFGIAAAYSRLFATGTAEVDVVERVHFIEYGLITFLFYRALRPAGDLSMLLLPVLAGVVVGSAEEWFQWFVPNRVGEVRDVFLNLVAIGCGLLFSAALLPPEQLRAWLNARSRRRVAAGSAAAVIAVTAFVTSVHLGHAIDAGDLTFRSRYSPRQLETLQRHRAERWRRDPPVTLRRFSREDQYLDEGFWHVRRRNQAWAAGDYATAWGENRILEEFFAPVLDAPTYAGPPGRWTDGQRAEAQRRAGPELSYSSDAEPFPILSLPRALVVSASFGIVLLIAFASRASNRIDDRRP